MRIAIVGAGGVGGYLAYRLIADGAEVAILARGAHLEAIRDRGLVLEETEGAPLDPLRPAAASDRAEDLGAVDLVVVAVKGQDLDATVAQIAPLMGVEGVALPFLNGVDAPDRLASRYGSERALIGTARISAVISAPGTIRKFTEHAKYTFGDGEGRQDRAPVPAIRARFEAAGIVCPDHPDLRVELWDKFVSLSAISAVTAGGRCDLAAVRQPPELWALFLMLLDETIAVARAKGIALAPEIRDRVTGFIDALPGTMRASLAHDLAAGKRLEVDWLSGAVARIGAELGVPTPAHRTVHALLAPWKNGPP
ncbi:MAG: ketopantoate reductase family protein [Paracoccaceae bacterium]